ncbi:MAG: hypothetical protein IT534_14555 [Bauldia sp.]|nr:hypothetical protein [Bauldia sp.]
MNSARRLFFAFAAVIAAVPAAAQPNRLPDFQLANRLSLGCAIENEKVFAVTNTTPNAIVEGTPVFVEIVRMPDGQRDVLAWHGATIPVGGTIREGIYQASACAAWIEVELMLAPSVLTPAPPGPAAPLGGPPTRAP